MNQNFGNAMMDQSWQYGSQQSWPAGGKGKAYGMTSGGTQRIDLAGKQQSGKGQWGQQSDQWEQQGGYPSAPPQQQVQLPRGTKTTLCTHFQANGFCKHADVCSFAHGEHEIGAPRPDPEAVAAHKANEMMNGPQGGGTGKRKTKLCVWFAAGAGEQGSCTSGDNCIFAHGDDELGKYVPINGIHPTAMAPAQDTNGNRLKTRMCMTYAD